MSALRPVELRMNSSRLITFSSRTYFEYFIGNVAYWRGCPSDPSDEVTTQGWRMNARMSSSRMLNEATSLPLPDLMIVRAASIGATLHESLATLQRFMAVLTVTALSLGAVIIQLQSVSEERARLLDAELEGRALGVGDGQQLAGFDDLAAARLVAGGDQEHLVHLARGERGGDGGGDGP